MIRDRRADRDGRRRDGSSPRVESGGGEIDHAQDPSEPEDAARSIDRPEEPTSVAGRDPKPAEARLEDPSDDEQDAKHGHQEADATLKPDDASAEDRGGSLQLGHRGDVLLCSLDPAGSGRSRDAEAGRDAGVAGVLNKPDQAMVVRSLGALLIHALQDRGSGRKTEDARRLPEYDRGVVDVEFSTEMFRRP